MKKKYLMKTIVAMAIAVVAAGCSRDFDVPSSRLSDDEAMENAEDQLGVTIDPNQTWSMTSTIKAEVTVNRDFGEEYTVTVYQNNPFVNNTGVVLGSSTVKSGQTTNFSFTGQKGTYLVYVAIKDKKGYSYVKPVSISEDKLVAVFGATTRSAADDFEIPALGQPFTTQQVADYLSRATEPNESNISYNHIGDYKEASEGHWVDGTAWGWDWAGIGAQLYYNRTNFDQRSGLRRTVCHSQTRIGLFIMAHLTRMTLQRFSLECYGIQDVKVGLIYGQKALLATGKKALQADG